MDKARKKIVSVNINGTYSLFLICWPLKVCLIGCPKMSVRNYHSGLHNIVEGRRSHMTIWQRTPWFGSARCGSEWSGMVLHTGI